jgi:hypothetical protein
MGKISGFLRGIVERNIIADDPDDEATQAFLENDKAIEAELARIAQYDAGLADVIRLQIGPKKGWEPSTIQMIRDLEQQTQGSMG